MNGTAFHGTHSYDDTLVLVAISPEQSKTLETVGIPASEVGNYVQHIVDAALERLRLQGDPWQEHLRRQQTQQSCAPGCVFCEAKPL